MNFLSKYLSSLLVIFVLLTNGIVLNHASAAPKIIKPWVTGYMPGYDQSSSGEFNFMDEDDWKMVTHVVHFAATVNSNGTLNFNAEGLQSSKRAAAISLAHAHNVPILISTNAWQDVYNPVLNNPSTRQTLITNLITVLNEGYDGIDLDLEPITPWGSFSNPGYEAFVNELHAQIQIEYAGKTTPLLSRPLLAVAAGSDGREAQLLARLESKLDQINIMFYNMATIWEEITWHDSALYDGGRVYPSTGAKVSSVDGGTKAFLAAGIPASKLGLGMSLEIRTWKGGVVMGTTDGVTAPMQRWSSVPKDWTSGTSLDSVAQLMQSYYHSSYYMWDDVAKMPYLSINLPENTSDHFISYNNPRSVAEKVNYAKQNGMGGVMLWHMRLDYQPEKPVGQRRPIMLAVRKALRESMNR